CIVLLVPIFLVYYLNSMMRSTEVNPLQKVSAIVHGNLKLSERYPTELSRRAKINSVMDWHYSNLRNEA
ncbi:hypothetical protein S83_040007, partial [Arachis hypogaea]